MRPSLSRIVFTGLLATALAGHSHLMAQSAPITHPAARSVASKPLWTDLGKEQQEALGPLQQLWAGMSEPHKRKWLALSRNFDQLSVDEKIVLQGRMREWAALTPQQRTLARLNFADVKQLPQEQRRALWDAYQALSLEDKQKLASQQPKPLQSAAPAVRPTPAERLAVSRTTNSQKTLPRIDTEQLAPGTLLPVPTPSVQPTAAAPAEDPLADSATTESAPSGLPPEAEPSRQTGPTESGTNESGPAT